MVSGTVNALRLMFWLFYMVKKYNRNIVEIRGDAFRRLAPHSYKHVGKKEIFITRGRRGTMRRAPTVPRGQPRRGHFFRVQSRKKRSLLKMKLCSNWQKISEISPGPPLTKGGQGRFPGNSSIPQYASLVPARPG